MKAKKVYESIDILAPKEGAWGLFKKTYPVLFNFYENFSKDYEVDEDFFASSSSLVHSPGFCYDNSHGNDIVLDKKALIFGHTRRGIQMILN